MTKIATKDEEDPPHGQGTDDFGPPVIVKAGCDRTLNVGSGALSL
jgi:hypothetical protein